MHIGQELGSGLDHRSLRFRHREGGHQKGGLDPRLPIQLLEVAVLHCDGDGVGQEGKVVGNLEIIAQLFLQGLGLHGLLRGDAGHSGLLRLPQGLTQPDGHGLHGGDRRIFEDHHGLDPRFLGVDLRAEADFLTLSRGASPRISRTAWEYWRPLGRQSPGTGGRSRLPRSGTGFRRPPARPEPQPPGG